MTNSPNKRAKYIAEGLATFCLVFFGTGAIIVDRLYNGQLTHLGVSLVFGFIVLAMIYTVGTVSGAHINPAVTLGFWAAGRISIKESGIYIAAQIAGAVAASLSLRFLFPGAPTLGETLPAGSLTQSFVLEFILTAVLMIVILGVAHDNRAEGLMAGVAIGATIALGALVGGPVSGASMNPARSLAPALAAGNFSSLWIYLTAPILGALAAAQLFPLTRCQPHTPDATTGCC